MTQVTTVDDLRSMRGSVVYFVRMMRFARYRQSTLWNQTTELKTEFFYRPYMFTWTVGKILYTSFYNTSNFELRKEPHGSKAFCFEDQPELPFRYGLYRAVRCEPYFLDEESNDLSGIFTDAAEAKARVAMIILACSDVGHFPYDPHEDVSLNKRCHIIEVTNTTMFQHHKTFNEGRFQA